MASLLDAIPVRDIRIDTYSTGGSWLLSNERVVCVTIRSSGLRVTSKDERSDHANKRNCFNQLEALLAVTPYVPVLFNEELKAHPYDEEGHY
jgi:protein subunit release factor A